jgi:hypothetical protein
VFVLETFCQLTQIHAFSLDIKDFGKIASLLEKEQRDYEAAAEV